MAAAKQQLRLWIRNVRDSIPDDVARAATAAARRRVLAYPLVRSAEMVAMYSALARELGTAELADVMWGRGQVLAYPRVSRGKDRLTFHRVESRAELSPGTLGILEPSPDAPVVPIERIDLFIVPGLAFDREGGRLGWGKGYYDAALAHNSRAPRIGYGFECQLVDEVPRSEWDAPLTHVVTEVGVRVCRHHRTPRSGA